MSPKPDAVSYTHLAKFQVICRMRAMGFADEQMAQVTELSLDMVRILKELCIQENERD